MNISDESKEILNLLESTNQNVFITGRAGTGKSTLLKHFRDTTKKNIAVIAPTGISALNVGGQTIHSFFKFKIGIIDREVGLISDKKLRDLYKKLDTLVIDEISMVRSDLFDCIEKFLRLNGPKPGQVFGGVQIVAIGDMFQLPPIVSSYEYDFFTNHYESPYFFDAKSYSKASFEIIELTKVYRQSDIDFINILDKIRTGDADDSDIAYLNSLCCESYDTSKVSNDSINIVSTNASADTINNSRLNQVSGSAKTYKGKYNGSFDRKSTPVPDILNLKIGAQIMMLRNDSLSRWVNGDIGIVKKLGNSSIHVQLLNGKIEEVESETWESVKYEFDNKNNRISSEVIGKYIQIPVKLAWAVTIHKSQGKTFDSAIIDFGRGTFAHGQAYVALSRVRSVEGIKLVKPLTKRDIQVDQRIIDFMASY
jgi:ATP-dependent DNA helicase PIF1